MTTYFSLRVVDDGHWWEKGPLLPGLHASDSKPVDTGLLDGRGRKIMRAPEPVGFHRATPRQPGR